MRLLPIHPYSQLAGPDVHASVPPRILRPARWLPLPAPTPEPHQPMEFAADIPAWPHSPPNDGVSAEYVREIRRSDSPVDRTPNRVQSKGPRCATECRGGFGAGIWEFGRES